MSRYASVLIVVSLIGAAWPALAGQEAVAPAMVILVRHAERAAEPKDDPALTEAGAARAQALAAALADAGITAIVTTERRRTRDTAAPIARARGVTPDVISAGAGAAHAEAVAAAVRKHAGEVVLVVGHSNTVPAIIAALGGPRLPDICDTVHANLFVLTFSGREIRLVRSRYGAPDPPGAPGCQ